MAKLIRKESVVAVREIGEACKADKEGMCELFGGSCEGSKEYVSVWDE